MVIIIIKIWTWSQRAAAKQADAQAILRSEAYPQPPEMLKAEKLPYRAARAVWENLLTEAPICSLYDRQSFTVFHRESISAAS